MAVPHSIIATRARTIPVALVLTIALLVHGVSGDGRRVDVVLADPLQLPNAQLTHAEVQTDADADSLMNKAARYVGDGQYREALLLYQHVVDHFPDAMVPHADGVFVPAPMVVRQILAGFPDEGLRAYRLIADAEARGVLGGPVEQVRDRSALQQVARRYFMAEVGDDAAYRLACLLIDAGEYREAATWLDMIVREHPAPSVDRRAMLGRLLIAAARSGQRRAATRAHAELKQLGELTDAQARLYQTELARLDDDAPAIADGWTMRGGGAGRDRVMPALTDSAMKGSDGLWAMLWRDSFALRSPHGQWGGSYYQLTTNAAQSRGRLVERWRQQGWLPTGQIVFADGRLYHKSHEAVWCRDAASGRVIWQTRSGDSPDANAQRRSAYNAHLGTGELPKTAEEALLFADQLAKAVSKVGEVIYHIRDNDIGVWLQPHELQQRQQGRDTLRGGNALVALDAKTGKPLWQIGRSAKHDDPLGLVRFHATPVPVGDHVVAPIEIDGELFLLALEPRSGKVIYKRFVCSYPASFSPQWAPCAMAVAGDELFLLPGEGLVVCASAADGSIRWARPYEQSHSNHNRHHRGNMQSRGRWTGIRGWEDNALLPIGDTLVAAPWDAQILLLLNRRTGELLTTDRKGEPAPIPTPRGKYLLGAIGDKVLTVEADQIKTYRIDSGKPHWRAPIPGATGRAAITAEAIYVPTGSHIVRLDPARDGKRIAEVKVVTPAGDPVGNLYSDGQRLLATGMNFVYALADADAMLARLGTRLDAGHEGAAYMQRARLHEQLEQPDAALADYRLAHHHAADAALRAEARDELVRRLIRRVQGAASAASAPQATAWLDEAATLVQGEPRLAAAVTLARADHLAAVGRLDQAVAIYTDLIQAQAELAEGEAGEATLTRLSDAHGVRWVRASTAAAEALARLVARHGPGVSDQLESAAAARYQAAAAALAQAPLRTGKVDAVRDLYHLAANAPGTDAAMRAITKLGEYDDTIGLKEPMVLLARLADGRDRRTAAQALAALGGLYELAGWPRQARDAYQRLASLGEAPVMVWSPPPAPQPAPGPHADGTPPPPAPVAPATAAADFAARRLAEIPAAALAVVPDRFPAPPLERRWEVRGRQNYLTEDLDADNSAFLDEHMIVLMRDTSQIACYPAGRLNADQPTWRIDVPREVLNHMHVSQHGVFFNGDLAGHLLVTRVDGQITGYSALTGKMLWTAEHDDPTFSPGNNWQSVQQRTAGVMSLAVGPDVVAIHRVDEQMNDAIEVIDATAAGRGRVIWRRRFEDAAINGAYVTDRHVAVVLEGMTRLAICDRLSGEVLGQTKLDQPAQRFVWADDSVMIYTGQAQVVCHALPDLEVRWERPCNNLNQFGLLDDQTAFIVDRSGRVIVQDLRTGRARAAFANSEVGTNTNEGLIAMDRAGTTLYAFGWDNRGKRALSILDLESAKRRTRIDLGQQHYSPPNIRDIARSTGPIPWAKRKKKSNGSHENHPTIVFYDRQTGKPIKDAELSLADPKNNRGYSYIYRGPIARGDALIVTTNRGLIAYQAVPNAPGGDGDGDEDQADPPAPDESAQGRRRERAAQELQQITQAMRQDADPAVEFPLAPPVNPAQPEPR